MDLQQIIDQLEIQAASNRYNSDYSTKLDEIKSILDELRKYLLKTKKSSFKIINNEWNKIEGILNNNIYYFHESCVSSNNIDNSISFFKKDIPIVISALQAAYEGEDND